MVQTLPLPPLRPTTTHTPFKIRCLTPTNSSEMNPKWKGKNQLKPNFWASKNRMISFEGKHGCVVSMGNRSRKRNRKSAITSARIRNLYASKRDWGKVFKVYTSRVSAPRFTCSGGGLICWPDDGHRSVWWRPSPAVSDGWWYKIFWLLSFLIELSSVGFLLSLVCSSMEPHRVSFLEIPVSISITAISCCDQTKVPNFTNKSIKALKPYNNNTNNISIPDKGKISSEIKENGLVLKKTHHEFSNYHGTSSPMVIESWFSVLRRHSLAGFSKIWLCWAIPDAVTLFVTLFCVDSISVLAAFGSTASENNFFATSSLMWFNASFTLTFRYWNVNHSTFTSLREC